MNIGFKIIKEMTRDELIEELLTGQRERMETETDTVLRGMVVQYRLDGIKRNLVTEAGMHINEFGIIEDGPRE